MYALSNGRLSFFARVALVAAAVLFGLTFNSSFAHAATGAIFTTNAACVGTNINLFGDKADVFLDGGPHHIGSAGLTPGDYYVQVTEPNGTLLGKSLTADAIVAADGSMACDQLNQLVFTASSSFTTLGYDDTTNGGGEYKVWVSSNSTFDNGTNKTDNFKVKTSAGPNPQSVGSISGLKWEDANADGVLDPGEQNIAGWTIQLYDAAHANLLATTQTDEFGFYSLDNIAPGTYQVCEVLQPTWFPSSPTTNTPNCQTDVVVTANQNVLNINFGNYQNATLVGTKWQDMNGNGTQDPEDSGIAGWSIAIAGPTASTQTTATDGTYSASVKPGTYTVCEVLQANWTQTAPAGGFDCSGTKGYQVTVTSGDTSQNALSFGNFHLGTISGLKFFDANANGTNDDEQNITGWQVLLVSANGATTTTTTNGTGYTFTDLPLGTYTVCEGVSKVGNWTQSAPLTGSCPNGTRGFSLTITQSGDIKTADFGNYCSVPSGGLTLGFWSNKNGQSILSHNDATWRNLLTNINLRKADGTNYDILPSPGNTFVAAYNSFRTWILGATATNMAYMLSAQLATMELNTQYGTASSSSYYVPAGKTIQQIMVEANASLGANGLTVASGPARTSQELLKNYLDSLNNGAAVVSGSLCSISF
jgi:hypothetical protein